MWRKIIAKKNIEELISNVSYQILDSIALLEVLDELMIKDLKIGTVCDIFIKQMNDAFKDIETCRKLISSSD